MGERPSNPTLMEPALLLTFVCCIEYGRLEDQTLLMLRSLRAFGGRLQGARVIAVVPRRGPSLTPAVLDTLRELGVELVHERGFNPAPWYNFMNKLIALRAAERLATTPLVAWLDSDVLVAAEPTGLLLDENEDLGARGEYLVPALYEGAPQQEPYWRAVCDVVGIRLEDLDFIDMDEPPVRMRRYFNAGIYVWRRGLGFPEEYIADFNKMMQSRLCLADGNIHLTDQVLLGVVATRLRMRCKHLGFRDHHMTFPGQIDGASASRPMNDSSLIHYSKSMAEPHRPAFLRRLESELPHVYRLVVEEPQRSAPTRSQRLAEIFYRGGRNLRLRWFEKTARRAPLGR